MHLALVRRRFAQPLGGAERYAVNLARGLARRGHQITIVAEALDQQLVPQADFLPVPVGGLRLTSKTIAFANQSSKLLASRRFDVVFGMARLLGLDVYRLTERLHVHWMTIRYGDPWQSALQKLNPRHRKLLALERSLFESPRVRKLIVQSQLDRQLVQQYYGIAEHRLCTIHNGVDTEVFRPIDPKKRLRFRAELGISDQQQLLVFASASNFRVKGLDLLLQALKRIPAARLLVVGKDSKKRSQALAQDLGVADRTLFVGYRDNMTHYYGVGDLLVLPTAYDPFPNVILEAMACGVPVVVSRATGTAEIISEGEHGYVIPMENPVDEIIQRIHSHGELSNTSRAALRRGCRALAETLSIENHLDRVVSVLKSARRVKLAAA